MGTDAAGSDGLLPQPKQSHPRNSASIAACLVRLLMIFPKSYMTIPIVARKASSVKSTSAPGFLVAGSKLKRVLKVLLLTAC